MSEVERLEGLLQERDRKIAEAMRVIDRFSQIDGGHHKAWVIDQVTRILMGDGYEAFVQDHKMGEDGPDTYSWDEGIAP